MPKNHWKSWCTVRIISPSAAFRRYLNPPRPATVRSMTNGRFKPPAAALWTVVSLAALAMLLWLASDRAQGLLINSAMLIAAVLAVSLPLGVALALAIAKTSLRSGPLLEGLLIGLLFVPLYVQAAAWQAALGSGGWLLPTTAAPWLTGWWGAVWVHAMAATPWVALLVSTALKTVPREAEEEALQDAGPLKVLLRVSLRRAGSGILAAVLWVVMICANEITVTDLYQVRTFAEEVYTETSLGLLGGLGESAVANDGSWLTVSDLWLGTFAISMLICALLAATRSRLFAADVVSPAQRWTWSLGRGRMPIGVAIWLLVIVLIGIPVVSLFGKAGMLVQQVDATTSRVWSFEKASAMVAGSLWEHRREWGWSLAIGTAAATLAATLGLLLAWAMRTRVLPTTGLLAILAIGFAVPGPLVGCWIIGLLNHPSDSPLALLSWCYDHTLLAPVMAQTLRALPLTTVFLWSQLVTLPQDVLDSATSEGASWWRRLAVIVLPLRWPALLAALYLALATAVGELAATLLVVPPGVSTLSIRIFGLLHYGAEDQVSSLCLALALAIGLGMTLVMQILRTISRRTALRAQQGPMR